MAESHKNLFLSDEVFLSVIEHTPLVSIDLIVKNQAGQVLLGQRRNKPAQGYWFVPGGRICKGESLSRAFARLAEEELGLSSSLESAKQQGVYEHFYQDCTFGDASSTHYVVLAYEVEPDEIPGELPLLQHSDYKWFSTDELMVSKHVHDYTKNYFRKDC